MFVHRHWLQACASLIALTLAGLGPLHSDPLALRAPPFSILVVDVPFEFLHGDFAALARHDAPTTLTFGDSQGGRLEFIVHLILREFLGGEISDTLNRDRIILERQPERPRAVFVVGVLHVGGDCPIANVHGFDVAPRRVAIPLVGRAGPSLQR